MRLALARVLTQCTRRFANAR